MQIRVLYFGVLKELVKRDGERMELPSAASVGTLLETLRARRPDSAGVWRSLAVAVNREYADAGRALHEGDEVALLPPVSGGTGGSAATCLGWKARREGVSIPPIARDKAAMDGAPGRARGSRRFFDFAAHEEAVRSFAEDDSFSAAGRGRDEG